MTGGYELEVLKQYKKSVELGQGYYWPGIDVNPKLLKLPHEVRHDIKIAQSALKDAIPKIKKDILELSKSRNELVRNTFKFSKKELDDQLKAIEDGMEFSSHPETSHLIGARLGLHDAVFVPRQDVLTHLDSTSEYWYENNVGERYFSSLVMTHWILAYHKRLEAAAKKYRT